MLNLTFLISLVLVKRGISSYGISVVCLKNMLHFVWGSSRAGINANGMIATDSEAVKIPITIPIDFAIALLLTRAGVLRELFRIPHILIKLKRVIENKESCDPTVLITPITEQELPDIDNHSACFLQQSFPRMILSNTDSAIK